MKNCHPQHRHQSDLSHSHDAKHLKKLKLSLALLISFGPGSSETDSGFSSPSSTLEQSGSTA